jgi:crossover junction endodeoxyribonuclease RuvC
MIILGIDPGTVYTGFGVVSFEKNKLAYISSGLIKPPKTKEMPLRLKTIYEEIDKIIKTFTPDEFALETAFYGKNVQSTMKIGYARGVAMLAAAKNDLHTAEYSPRTVKQSVVGRGAASKEQVQFMVLKLLAVPHEKKIRYDETDALAVAICHAFRKNLPAGKKGSWKEFLENNPDRVKE